MPRDKVYSSKGPIRSCSFGRGKVSDSQGSHRRGASVTNPLRILQHLLLGSQENRGPKTHSKPQTFQQVHLDPYVQNGIPGQCHSVGRSGRMASVIRPKGRLSSHSCSSSPLQVVKVFNKGNKLSMEGAAIRPINGSSSFHKGLGPSSSHDKAKGHSYSSLPRRSFAQSRKSSTTSVGFTRKSSLVAQGRVCDKLKKVRFDSIPGLGVHRGEVQDRLGDGLSPRSSSSVSHPTSKVFQGGKIVHSKSLAKATGGFGVYHPCGQRRQTFHEANTAVHPKVLVPSTKFQPEDSGYLQGVSTSQLVGSDFKPKIRYSPLPARICTCSNFRCIWKWLGRGSRQLFDSKRSMGSTSENLAYKLSGNDSGVQHSKTFSVRSNQQGCSSQDGQLCNVPLSKQDGGHQVDSVVHSSLGSSPVVQVQEHSTAGGSCSRRSKCTGGLSIKGQGSSSTASSFRPEGMVLESKDIESGVHSLRETVSRFIRFPSQSQTSQMVQFCQGTGSREVQCIPTEVGCFRLRIPSTGHTQEGNCKDKEGQVRPDTHCSSLAPESVGLGVTSNVSRHSSSTSPRTESAQSEGSVLRQPSLSQSSGLESVWQTFRSRGFSEEVINTLQSARKSSTRESYNAQWTVYNRWCNQRNLDPFQVPVAGVLEFLNEMFNQGKAFSTIKGYTSALTAVRGKLDGFTFATHPDISTFIKGVFRRRPPVKPVFPCWDLELVLNFLLTEDFEPSVNCSLSLWTLKTVFLVAVTSASRCGELQALDIRPELSVIRRKSASLRTNPAFLPKIANPDYLNRIISLEAFQSDPKNKVSRSLQGLCPVRALNIYLEKTSAVRRHDVHQLFVSFKHGKEGLAVSKQCISGWLVSTIRKAYDHFQVEQPEGIKAHSVRAVGSSMACAKGACIADICRAATWADGSVFAKFYRLDMVPQGSSLSHAVLSGTKII